MDTASPLGFGKAHVCRYLMLCWALVTMTAHTTQGIPVLQRITPTAKVPYRPSTPTFPYRKSFRSWAKKHEDLWVAAPSGDGPTEHWEFSHAPDIASLPKTTVDEYATRSPTPEDIFPSQSDPFPSIIDTAVDSPEAFSDEVLSRSSATYEGPSSLLNTLIFRPSVSEESAALTPSFGTSSIAVQATYDLTASWTDLQELVSSFTMSSRRAISDIPSEVYAIITAISATHIYRDDSWTADPSGLLSDDSFNPGMLSSSMERIPDHESISQLNYFPSFTTNDSVHLQTSYDAKQPHFTNHTHSVQQETFYSITSSQTFTFEMLPQNISDSFTESAFSSDASIMDIDNRYPATFVAATYLHWSPFTTPIDVHTSSISSEKYYFSDMSLDSSFSDSVFFISPSRIMPIFTTFNTFLLNTVETTVTIIDNKETPYTFILPTLTVSGTSFNKTHENLSNLLYDFTFSSSLKELEYGTKSTFSSFKHISSNFDTELTSFLRTEENSTLLTTQFSDSPMGFVPFTDQTSVLPSEIPSSQQNKQEPLSMTSISFHHPQSTFITFDKISEIFTSSNIFYGNHTLPGIEKLLSSRTITLIKSEFQLSLTKPNTNQTEFNMISIESSKQEIVSHQISAFQTKIPHEGYSVLIQESATSVERGPFTELFPSVRTSFDILEEQNVSPLSWKPTESLTNEIIYNTHERENDILSAIQSLKDEATLGASMQSSPKVNRTLLDPSPSNDDYFETSSHHVTYRSLNETLNFYTSDYETTKETFDMFPESFISNKPNDYFSSTPVLSSISYISSTSSITEEIKISPSQSQAFQETSHTTVKPILMDSEEAINEDSTILFEYPRVSEKHITEPPITFILTSYHGDFFPFVSSTQPFEKYFEDLSESLWKNPSRKYVLEESSLQDQMTQSLEVSSGTDYTTIISELSSSSVKIITSANYPITSTTILDDYSHNLSKFDNYFLESSNLSSKSLEEHHLEQSLAINGSRKEIYNNSIEYNTLLSSENIESSFDKFTINTEVTPTISSSMRFQLSSLDSISSDTTSEKTYLEPPASAEALDETTEIRTMKYASLEHQQSLLYDTFKTHISNADISSDFFISLTPSFSFYPISSYLSFDTLNSAVSPEHTSYSIHTIPQILPHSVIIKSHSEINNEKSAGLESSNGIALHPSLIDTTTPAIKTQIQINESIYTPFDHISIISQNKEISLSKIDALDLSIIAPILSQTPSISRTENFYAEHSTMMKEPRSLDFYHSSNELPNEFEVPPFPYTSFDVLGSTFLSKESPRTHSTDFDTNFINFHLSSTYKMLESITETLESRLYTSIMSKLRDKEESVYSETNSYDSLITSAVSMYDASTATEHLLQTFYSSVEIEPQTSESDLSWSLNVPLITPKLSNGKEHITVESHHPYTGQNSFETLISHTILDSMKQLYETSVLLNGKEPENTEADYQEPKSTLLAASLLSSSFVNLESLKSPLKTFISVPAPEQDKSKSIDWNTSKPKASRYFPTPELTPGYETSVVSKSPSTSHTKANDPLSIESDHPKPRISSSFQTVSPSHTKAIDPLSIESDHPKPRISSSFQTVSASHTKAIDPLSIESDHPKPRISSSFQTVSPSHTKAIDPLSIESDHPKPRISSSFQTVSPSHTRAIEPLSIESDHPKPRISSSLQTVSPSHTRAIDPLSIESDHPKPRTSSSFQTVSPSHTRAVDPLSIESDHPKPKITITSQTYYVTHHTSFLSAKPHFELTSTTYHEPRPSSAKMSTLNTFSKIFSSADLKPTWSDEDNTTPDESVLVPVSSYLNINYTKNSSNVENSHTNEKSQVDETLSTSGEDTSTDRTNLFKDNHYWVLTVLEAPVKGQLPENFSHTMEIRLANAYSEAFRIRALKNNDTRRGQERILVKILSLTNDLLLRHLDIVYVVEHGGSLVPANVASEYLNSLRFEQLREFLGHHVIIKARPYQPNNNERGREVGSPLPVLAIVGGVLGGLLFLLCCFCVYCRCCRPKPAPSTPESSTSGSLQRSLSKYGQHNRKHLFREMTHQLTAEMAAQMKHGSSAADAYLAEKTASRSLPTLPREGQADAADKSMKILKILENKDASTSPVAGKSSKGGMLENDTSSSEKLKRTPKPKRRRKIKDSHEQQHARDPESVHPLTISRPESPPPTPPPKGDVSIPTAESRQSCDSGTSSRHASTLPSSPSEKSATETESEGSNVELLPSTQDQIDRREVESPAAVETQLHLSRVRQRIGELLDDAFALAGGRKLYGSLRSKKVEPTADILPRFGSFRSQSAIGGDYAFRHPRGGIVERRPLTEGGQRLLGVITDEGQLLTHPTPKPVWDHEEEMTEGPIAHEVIEARNLNLFPFHPLRSQHTPVLPSFTASGPELDHGPGLPQSEAALATTLREAASELRLARSSRMNPAVVDQYDEIDVVGALRNGEPIEALVKAIKDELQRFSGSLPGASDGESHA